MNRLIGFLGMALIVAGVAIAEVRTPIPESIRYSAKRGSSNLPNPQPTSDLECDGKVKAAIDVEGRTRTTGEIVYQCITTKSYIVRFQPPPVVVSPVDCGVSEWGAWSNPPFEACAGTQQTRALVRTRTIVIQPVNGGAACPGLVESQTETRRCPGIVILSWTPPAQNTNGTPLTNLAGYRIHYGTSEHALTQTIQVANPALAGYVVQELATGTYYFTVRAYTSAGTESDQSNVIRVNL